MACAHQAGYTALQLHDSWLCQHTTPKRRLTNDLDTSLAAFREAEERLLRGEL